MYVGLTKILGKYLAKQ